MTIEWLQAQLIAYSLQQTNTRADISGRYAEIILAEMRKELLKSPPSYDKLLTIQN